MYNTARQCSFHVRAGVMHGLSQIRRLVAALRGVIPCRVLFPSSACPFYRHQMYRHKVIPPVQHAHAKVCGRMLGRLRRLLLQSAVGVLDVDGVHSLPRCRRRRVALVHRQMFD